MIIGIDASRAFLKNRTGIEEYSYRVIEYLMGVIPEETRVVLYVKKGARRKAQGAEEKSSKLQAPSSKFQVPRYEIREVKWNRFWTQGGLSWEMMRRPVDVLLVPAHTVPWVHPKKTVVVIHGLEYEMCPGAYSFWEKWFMRVTIRLSCRWASTIIAVSENTKKDLVRLYGVAEEKVRVIYEGIPKGKREKGEGKKKFEKKQLLSVYPLSLIPYLLFIGRIEERKNIVRIIEAFERLKEKYSIPHKLILAGKPGYGYQNVKCLLPPLRLEDSTPPLGQGRGSKVKCREDIVLLGYVSDEEKWELLRNADMLLFPSLYEGFGLPILEAQSVGVPVVTSNVSSMPEVVDKRQATSDKRQDRTHNLQPTTYNLQPASAVLVDPYDVESIAEGIYSILSDTQKREQLISLGYENVKRFSWEKCAQEIAESVMRNKDSPF